MTDAYQASNVSPADIAAARAAVSGDALAARPPSGDALGADFNQLIQEQRQGAQKLQQIMEAGQRAQAPLISQALQMGKDLRQFQGNPPIAQPLPPTPQRNNPGEDEQWLMAAMVLGAIGGAFTRQHVTNGLAAMTGALEGYQAGSKEKFEQNLKLWKAESEKAKEANDQANTRYRQILESKKMAWDQKMQEIQLVAAQYKDLAAMQLVQNGQGEKIGDLTVRRDEASAKMEQMKLQMQRDFQRMEETKRHNLAMEKLRGAGAAAGGGDVEDVAQAIAHYRQPPLTSGYAARSPYAQAVMKRVYEISREEGSDYVAARYPSISRALTAFSTGKQGDIVRSLNVSIDHLDTIQELGQALKTKDLQTFNRIAQALGAETGNPAPTNLNEAAAIVSAEIQKALAASTQAERMEGKAAFDRVKSPEQLAGAVQTAQKLLAGQMRGLKLQYDHAVGPLAKSVPFEDMLEPRTVEVLGSLKPAVRGVTPPSESGGAPSGGGPPPAAIEHLRQNPNLREQFEQKYGPGSAARVLDQS